MNNASDPPLTDDVSTLGAGISLAALVTFDLTGNSALIIMLFLHLRKSRKREITPGTTFQLLLYFAIAEFAYSVTVELISVVCYLVLPFDLKMSRGLCLFQAWASLTLTVSATWTMTLLAVDRLLSGTYPVSLPRRKRRRDRLLYTCYTGFIISALVAVVPVTREGSVKIFDPSSSFCHFNYNLSDDAVMTSFCIAIVLLTFVLFQVQLYSFLSLLWEERQTNIAVRDDRKFDYGEQNTSTSQNLTIHHEYWLHRKKIRNTFAGKQEWNITATVLALIGWLWMCSMLFMVTLVISQAGGEVSPQTSFAAVRMLSIHNAVSPFLVIFIFAPFRRRALHFLTCGRIQYSRDDFIVSRYLDHDVTKNSEPNWWKVVESNQWNGHETTPTPKHKDLTYIYENDVNDDEVDSYYESDYGSYSRRSNEVPSSVYYLNEEKDVSGNYLLAVPVNQPGAGSGEFVERIFILHESQKNVNHSNGSFKSSPELLGEDVSYSPKLKQVVQSAKFKELLQRNRRGAKDISPRLFKVGPSATSQRGGCAFEMESREKVVAPGRDEAISYIESVQMTPQLKRIVESAAFQKTALSSDSFVIESESSSSSPEHERRSGPTFIRLEETNYTSTPKKRSCDQSQNLRKCVLQRQESRTGSPTFSKPSNKSHLITMIEAPSNQHGGTKSKKSVTSPNDVELIQLSDESATSLERQINTPERRRKRERKSHGNELERITRKKIGDKYKHSLPREAALLQDVGNKPLQVLGLSPKYGKDKHEENGMFSKGDDRPEILNALFQKALLIGSSTNIIDEDELVKTAGGGKESLAKDSAKKPGGVEIVRNKKEDHWQNDGMEFLIDGHHTETSSDSTPAKANKQCDHDNSVKSGRVAAQSGHNQQGNIDKINEDEKSKGRPVLPSERDSDLSANEKDQISSRIDEHMSEVQVDKEMEGSTGKENDIRSKVDGDDGENFVREKKSNSSQEAVWGNLNNVKSSVDYVPIVIGHFNDGQFEQKRELSGNKCWKDGKVALNGYREVASGDGNVTRHRGVGQGKGKEVTIPAIVVSNENESGDPNELVITMKEDEQEDNFGKITDKSSNNNNGDDVNRAGNIVTVERTLDVVNGTGKDGTKQKGDDKVEQKDVFSGRGLSNGGGVPSRGDYTRVDGIETSGLTITDEERQGQNLSNQRSSNDCECVERSPTRQQVNAFVDSILQNIMIENGDFTVNATGKLVS